MNEQAGPLVVLILATLFIVVWNMDPVVTVEKTEAYVPGASLEAKQPESNRTRSDRMRQKVRQDGSQLGTAEASFLVHTNQSVPLQ